MEIDILTMLFLMFLHWVADFVLQSRYVAEHKSEDISLLGAHCIIYALPFIIIGFKFAVFLCLTHFLIDYVTSRQTKHCWKQHRVHDFFTIIGFDQFLHATILMLGHNLFC